MNKKSKIYVLVLIWTAAIVQLFVNKAINREENLVEQAMSLGVNNLTEGVAKAYGFYSNEELSEKGAETIVKNIATTLGITSGYDISHKKDERNVTTTLTKEGEYGDTVIKVISFTSEDSYGQEIPENYLMTEITLKGVSGQSAYEFKEHLEDIYQGLGVNVNTNLYLCSQIKGQLTGAEKQNMIDAFLTEMDAKEVVTNEFQNVLTVYGYSKNVDEFVYQNEDKVNVNIAFSYDEEEDITYIHRAIPFIDRSF